LAFIGLGSNLGNREEFLRAARSAMTRSPQIDLIERSNIARTTPVDNPNQPEFLNQVVSIETGLSPHALLETLQSIENDLGRLRSVWKGPRTIDLDILLFDGRIIADRDLNIPHPELLNRPFLIRQILEIAPETIDPSSRKRLSTFLPDR
jgi:2-amino-4-hydroxy-6-hydroxymethyldihydropteridine diphosphokinase